MRVDNRRTGASDDVDPLPTGRQTGTRQECEPDTAIADVTTDTDAVTVHAEVQRIGPRPVYARGTEEIVSEGVVADRTGAIPFRSRQLIDAAPGDRLCIRTTVGSRDGAPILRVGSQAPVRVTDRDPTADNPAPIPLASASPGDRAVTIEAMIVEHTVTTVDSPTGHQRVRRGVLGDRSARLSFTDWTARPGLADGMTIRCHNVYIGRFRGIPIVNLSRFSSIAPPADPLGLASEPVPESIGSALATGSQHDIVLQGTIVKLLDGSGLIARCPHCNRVIDEGNCRRHGAVAGQRELRTKAVMDDGTGSVTIVLDDSITASIYGAGLEGAREEAQATMQHEVVADRIADVIVGRPFRIRGRLSLNEFGANVAAESFSSIDASSADRTLDTVGRSEE